MQEADAAANQLMQLGLRPEGGGSAGPSSQALVAAAGARVPSHSNLYVNRLPAAVSEEDLVALFGQYGRVESVRAVRTSSHQGTGRGFAFVKMSAISEAMQATVALNGILLGGAQLEVKFADADAGDRNPELLAPPSDNLYCKQLPPTFTSEDLRRLFSPFGTVIECRLLHKGKEQCSGGMVRMSSVEAASLALSSLHNHRLPGSSMPLVVRFADTAEQKAKRQVRQLRLISGAARVPGAPPVVAVPSSPAGGPSLPVATAASLAAAAAAAAAVPGAVAGAATTTAGWPSLAGGYTTSPAASALAVAAAGGGEGSSPNLELLHPSLLPSSSSSGALQYLAGPSSSGVSSLLPPALASVGGPMCSIYIKHLPEQADRLFLYEKFAPFGAVLSVKVLVDEATGLCKGVGFVNYAEPSSAVRAVQAMHGMPLGERRLHVSIQHRRAPR